MEADFRAILSSTEGKSVLADSTLWDGLVSAELPSSSAGAEAVDAATRLIVSIALLHSFIQANFTGPDLAFTPSELVPAGQCSDAELNGASLPLLTLGGEPAYHLSSHPTLLLLARRILLGLSSESGLVTLPWWKLRLHAAHQSLLDEPVPIDPSTLAEAQALLDSIPEDSEAQDTRAALHVELGLYHHSLGNDKPSNLEFLAAAKASGLTYELTGALGRKTKYQVAALTQLVLLAESRKREGEEATTEDEGEKEAGDKDRQEATALPEGLKLNDDTLLEETAFTANSRPDAESSGSALAHLDPGNQPPLHPLDQALLLGLCLNTHNALPSSGLTASQMMPFLARVVQHPRNWSVHTTALLLRSRLEATRSRTVERATLQLQALIEQMPTSDSTTKERLRYVHQLPLPSKWEMERELAKRYLTVGVTRSALDMFTRLEMWEDAVACLQRMDREDEAERIVKDLLEGKKVESDLVAPLARAGDERKTRMHAAREAKLWCLLGDIALGSDEASKDPIGTRERAEEMYNKAWDISNATSSRSRRSLGSLLVAENKNEEAIPVLQDAVRINPLYARVWFTLGVCFTRLEKWVEARDAFRRQVGVDEEDGEGWNNLAAVYLRVGEVKGDDEVCPISSQNSEYRLIGRLPLSRLKTSSSHSAPYVPVCDSHPPTGACGPTTCSSRSTSASYPNLPVRCSVCWKSSQWPSSMPTCSTSSSTASRETTTIPGHPSHRPPRQTKAGACCPSSSGSLTSRSCPAYPMTRECGKPMRG